MRVMIRRGIFWLGIALVLAYWPIAVLVPGDVLGDILRVLQAVASVIVIAAYAPYGLDGIRSGHPTKAEQLALAITLGFAAVGVNGLWFLLWRWADRPRWMTDSFVNHFTLWLVAVASILYINASSALQGGIHSRKSIVIAATVLLAMVAMMIALLAVPDPRAFVEEMRPYLHR